MLLGRAQECARLDALLTGTFTSKRNGERTQDTFNITQP
jgi:hypothetical protein